MASHVDIYKNVSILTYYPIFWTFIVFPNEMNTFSIKKVTKFLVHISNIWIISHVAAGCWSRQIKNMLQLDLKLFIVDGRRYNCGSFKFLNQRINQLSPGRSICLNSNIISTKASSYPICNLLIANFVSNESFAKNST